MGARVPVFPPSRFRPNELRTPKLIKKVAFKSPEVRDARRHAVTMFLCIEDFETLSTRSVLSLSLGLAGSRSLVTSRRAFTMSSDEDSLQNIWCVVVSLLSPSRQS